MLGKLKSMAVNGAVNKVVGAICPQLQDQLKAITSFNASDLKEIDLTGDIPKLKDGFEKKLPSVLVAGLKG